MFYFFSSLRAEWVFAGWSLLIVISPVRSHLRTTLRILGNRDLGIDAFTVKSKRKSLTRTEKTEEVVDVSTNRFPQGIIQNLIEKDYEFIHDTTGYFKIYVDHHAQMIEALFLPFDTTKERIGITGSLLLTGKTAESIYKTIDKLGLVKEISHAFYVGKELSKAEYALHINAAYFEDTDIE